MRLHLSLHVFEDKPVRAAVRAGRVCERAVWEEQLEAGAAYIADRYIGENYKLFYKLARKGCAFVVRLLDNAVECRDDEHSDGCPR